MAEKTGHAPKCAMTLILWQRSRLRNSHMRQHPSIPSLALPMFMPAMLSRAMMYRMQFGNKLRTVSDRTFARTCTRSQGSPSDGQEYMWTSELLGQIATTAVAGEKAKKRESAHHTQ